MQIFRYMVYIWETYAKEAEKIQKDITRRADFKYPPILPIVYYEGSKKWTVPLDFKSRIIEGEAFRKYLPDFEYYLVPLRNYSNKELLAKKDEISLVMLINRMQNEDDVEEFRNLPTSEVESILQDTPEHLLDIISNILRTFLLKMKFSETETEELVGKVKEKKMGILFENVVPFDIEKARRKAEEAERQANIRIATAEAKAAQAELDANAKVAQAEQDASTRVDNLLRTFIEFCQDMNLSKEEVVQKLLSKYEMNEKSALEKINFYWKD